MAQLSRASGMTVSGLEAYVYFLEGSEAVDHLLRVSAGLESLVLGEPQILGQVTESFMSGSNGEAFGPQLTALFRIAIRAGKRARSETAISSRPASIPSVAIAKAQEIAGDLRLRNPLVVGMGEMGRLALKSLQSRGVRRISVANRNREVAESFAEGCKGSAYGMAELARGLAESDVVISATAAPHIVIRPELVKQAMARRGNRPLVLVDIAVPRDIDPGVADIPGVHLFDMDDLNGSLDEALAARRQEVPKVEAILSEERAAFEEDLRQISVRPLIAGLYQKAEFIRQQELKRTLRSLDGIDLRTAEQIQLFSRSLVNKLLHHPTVRLKEVASNGEADVYADTVRHLFALEAEGVIDDA
jgi:glutamyl-tRNA reductase